MVVISKIFTIERVGGVTRAAAALGVPLGTLSAWCSRGRIPAPHVLEVERLTGVSRYDLRPDIFGPAPQSEIGDERVPKPEAAE